MCVIHENQINMNSLSDHDIKRVEEFKYLGSYIGSIQQKINIVYDQ